ncbi:MAG TPA: hypothetical protein VGC66_10375 [Pyrinomonadaceae bacterium]
MSEYLSPANAGLESRGLARFHRLTPVATFYRLLAQTSMTPVALFCRLLAQTA